MRYTIANEQLCVQISDRGAELQSVRGADGVERLWQGDPAIWPDRAPLLFPFIARLKNETYTINGASYHMPIHGFANAKRFAAARQGAQRIDFVLESDADTRSCYPFDFTLTVRYALDGARLTKTFTVENRSATAMLYELGGHDGWRTALAPGERMADYYVEFPGCAVLRARNSDESLMLLDETRPVALDAGRLFLTEHVFAQDALILENLPCTAVTLGSVRSGHGVTLDFTGFPYLGVWSRYGCGETNYVCLEPWSALPDGAFLGTELSEKIGVRTLAPGGTDTLRYMLSFF